MKISNIFSNSEIYLIKKMCFIFEAQKIWVNSVEVSLPEQNKNT
mgnify:CR=1 FL=1